MIFHANGVLDGARSYGEVAGGNTVFESEDV